MGNWLCSRPPDLDRVPRLWTLGIGHSYQRKDVMNLSPSTTDAIGQRAMAGSQILNLTFWSVFGVPTGTYSSKDHGEAAARADALDAASCRMRVLKGVKSLPRIFLTGLPHHIGCCPQATASKPR